MKSGKNFHCTGCTVKLHPLRYSADYCHDAHEPNHSTSLVDCWGLYSWRSARSGTEVYHQTIKLT
eukprot:scaffold22690_cov163-Cylindrotheca_fusiformis.AAC.2